MKAKTSTLIILFREKVRPVKILNSSFNISKEFYIKCYIFVSTLQINLNFQKSSSTKNVSKLPVLFLDQLGSLLYTSTEYANGMHTFANLNI